MKKSVIIWIVAAVVIIIGLGSYLALYNNDSSVTPTTQSPAPSASSSSSDDDKVAATITYSNTGFSPNVTTVKSGDIVAVVNTSSSDCQMDSDPHPQHTDNTDLNVGLVSAGQTKTFTVTKMGTFGFHNHFKASDRGTITIQ